MAYEGRCCPQCQTYESLVPQGPSGRKVATPDGRTFGITLYRCQVCGLEEMVRRNWRKEHENDEPTTPGGPLASDGLIFIPRPFEEDDDG